MALIRNDSVRLGLMPPLTGLVGLYGGEISRAAKIAVDEINEAGGVLGKRLELIIEDDQSLPDTAVPAARRLVDVHGCTAIIGNLLSNSRIAVANQVAEVKKIPYLNFSFYEGSILSRYFFHFAALPNQQIDKMIPYMGRKYGQKMFFAGSNYEWPRGSIDAAIKALRAFGGEVVGEQYLPLGTTDIDGLLDSVAKSGADVFVPYFAGVDQINLLTRFTEKGLKKRMAVVMGHYDEAMVGGLPPEVREGFYSSNTYFMGVETPENRAFLKRLAAEPGVTGIWPKGNGVLTNFGEGTYLCVKAFAKAAEEAGSLETEALLRALSRITVTGPQGTVTMNPDTNHANVNTYLARSNADGSFTVMETFGNIPSEIPERYRHKPLGGQLDGEADSSPAQSAEMVPYLQMAIIIVNADGVITHVNQAALGMFGYKDAAGMVGKPGAALWENDKVLHDAREAMVNWGYWRGIMRCNVDGKPKELDVMLEPSLMEGGAAGYMATCINPAETDFLPYSTRAEQMLSVVEVAIIATDQNGVITRANKHALELFGYSLDEMKGMSVHLLIPPHLREMHKKAIKAFVASNEMERRMGTRGELAGYRKDGAEFPAEASIAKIWTESGWMLVASIRDITSRKLVENELIWKATHDPLTNLPNRAMVRERIANALARSVRAGDEVAVLLIDLDGFKRINDTYGHDEGDKVLKKTSNHLLSSIRPGDTVSRFGGDEFVIICEGIKKQVEAYMIADRIVTALRNPIVVEKRPHFLTGSIGISFGKGDLHTPEELLRKADSAMYAAKQGGRDKWEVHSADMESQNLMELEIANGLRTAVENDELLPYFQPIVGAQSGRIVGAELLARWQMNGKWVSPAVFIPIAEGSGSIMHIGYWAFEAACKTQAEMAKMLGAAPLPYLSVNVSTRQLSDPRMAARFEGIMRAHNALPEFLILEITETALMTDVKKNIAVLNELAMLGLKVAVDDFGTGYSSLGNLQRMPVNKLKIDKSFVDGLVDNKETQSIVSAVINMSHALDLTVIAEGVETEEQRAVLNNLGCDNIQGYLFWKPMEKRAFLDILPSQFPIAAGKPAI